MSSKGRPSKPMVILVGPSGVGKSSLVDMAIKNLSYLVDIVTCTTRQKREKEKDGDPYYFMSVDEFQKKRDSGFFVEWAQVHTNFYGTPRDQMEKTWADGKVVIIDVDVQGAKSIKAQYPETLTVFVLPPTIDSLRKRLEGRDGVQSKDIELRLANGQKELKLVETFDKSLINDDLPKAFSLLKKMIEDYLGKV